MGSDALMSFYYSLSESTKFLLRLCLYILIVTPTEYKFLSINYKGTKVSWIFPHSTFALLKWYVHDKTYWYSVYEPMGGSRNSKKSWVQIIICSKLLIYCKKLAKYHKKVVPTPSPWTCLHLSNAFFLLVHVISFETLNMNELIHRDADPAYDTKIL